MKHNYLTIGPFTIHISVYLKGYGWYVETDTCANPYSQSSCFFEDIDAAKLDAENWVYNECEKMLENSRKWKTTS